MVEAILSETVVKYFKTLDVLDGERLYYKDSAENHAGKSPSDGFYECSARLEQTGIMTTYWSLCLTLTRHDLQSSDRVESMRCKL